MTLLNSDLYIDLQFVETIEVILILMCMLISLPEKLLKLSSFLDVHKWTECVIMDASSYGMILLCSKAAVPLNTSC